MVSKPRSILIISDNKEQRKTLQNLIGNNDLKGIEFKIHAITFKECRSHRLNEPALDLIVIGYDVVDYILIYLLRAIKEKKIVLFFSQSPTHQQKVALRKHNVVATFTEPISTEEFQKILVRIF